MASQKKSTYKVTKASQANKNKPKKSVKANDNIKKDNKSTELIKANKPVEQDRRTPGILSQITPYLMAVVAIFLGLCIFLPSTVGYIGGGLHNIIFGLFSGAAYTLPVFLLIHAFTWRRDSEKGKPYVKIIYSSVTFILTSILMHVFASGNHDFFVKFHYSNGIASIGGGVIGGVLGELMRRGFGTVGTAVIVIATIIVLVLLLFNITPRGLYILVAYKIKMARERAEERRMAEYDDENIDDIDTPYTSRVMIGKKNDSPVSADADQMQLADEPYHKPRSLFRRKNKFNPDVDVDMNSDDQATDAETDTSDLAPVDEKVYDEVKARDEEKYAAINSILNKKYDTPTEEVSGTVPTPEVVTGLAADAITQSEIDALSATSESIKPIVKVRSGSVTDSATDSQLDLKQIFVNPDDAALLDKLADAYLRGESKTVSLSGTSDSETALGSDMTEADIELEVLRRQLTETYIKPKKSPEPQPVEYIFPPIDLLTLDTSKRDENIRDELYENADKLVETLDSFNVHTKIVDVCRGPTITRYELIPEAGTRVRSIANLVDDISLNLATTGVRIEAPIPGKAAVGIEVPNKNSAIVHLRTLIDDDKFRANKSNLNVALGEDVAGTSVYLDIAKMPHLLIAGATGMGKSVCINSLIVSLLYKANPRDVKLILIDPKKVELNIYNGLPHLLTPVVSDPKKAAGSLAWAVNEMERRFSLIEDVGVRDLKTYNEIIKGDPDRERLPQIVIIIDELADLMMTAPDDVEQSICRLAQKARAAGMHLIIGTQRPSVDVITGLIKSNIPSRIAFTVASQVDSRTIIDRAGAESLIGRGDMLYNPVGAAKPIRVQGAFVSEKDVEKIVQHIKDTCGPSEYSKEVLEQIEKEAAHCGTGKKGAAAASADGVAGDEDPMLRSALELAVDSGKISTSLIQRRLSLGYGRAAKLIDRMEELGFVSAPEGQKPREVLITKEQFMEMVLRDEQ